MTLVPCWLVFVNEVFWVWGGEGVLLGAADVVVGECGALRSVHSATGCNVCPGTRLGVVGVCFRA